jgi:hypothetical protein
LWDIELTARYGKKRAIGPQDFSHDSTKIGCKVLRTRGYKTMEIRSFPEDKTLEIWAEPFIYQEDYWFWSIWFFLILFVLCGAELRASFEGCPDTRNQDKEILVKQ